MMDDDKRFFTVDYDEIYYICDKTKINVTYNELVESYDGDEFAEEMAKDDYFQKALDNSLDGDEVVVLLNDYDSATQKLECQLKRRTRQRNELAEFNVELMEENKQLKSALSDLDWSYEQSMDNEIETANENLLLLKDVKQLQKENEELKQRINSRLHFYRELSNRFDKDDGFSYDIVKRVVEDLEDLKKGV